MKQLKTTDPVWITSNWSHGSRTHQTSLRGYPVRIQQSRKLRQGAFELSITFGAGATEHRRCDTLAEAKGAARRLLGLSA